MGHLQHATTHHRRSSMFLKCLNAVHRGRSIMRNPSHSTRMHKPRASTKISRRFHEFATKPFRAYEPEAEKVILMVQRTICLAAQGMSGFSFVIDSHIAIARVHMRLMGCRGTEPTHEAIGQADMDTCQAVVACKFATCTTGLQN